MSVKRDFQWYALCAAALFVMRDCPGAAQVAVPQAQVQATPAPQTAPTSQPDQVATSATVPGGGRIHGTVHSGTSPLPGVSVTATNTLTGKRYATTTDIAGAYAMVIPRNGRYVVRAELAAFAGATQEVLLNAAGENGGKPEGTADFGLELASRVAEQEQGASRAASTIASALGRGTQSLGVLGSDADTSDASAGTGNSGSQLPTLGTLGGGDTASLSSDSVAVSGQMGQTNGLANLNEDEVRQRIEDAVARARQQGGATGDIANAVVGMLGGMMGPGGSGSGFGGGGGGRGGRGGGGGGFRGFNPSQPHGNIFYQGGNGALDATNYSLSGVPVKPAYSNNRFGISFVGSPFIPGLVKASTKQFVFFNVTGMRNINPVNLNGTVPTLAERAGDFSALTQIVNGKPQQTPIYDPASPGTPANPGAPFLNNIIPASRLSPEALRLLNFYPAPNIPDNGSRYNYQTITTAGSNSTQASLRFVRNFGQQSGRFGGFGGSSRHQAANGPKALRQNINFNGSYSHTASDLRTLFQSGGGAQESDGYGISAGYTLGYGRITNNASINWNRSHATTRNYFTDTALNPSLASGVAVPSQGAIGARPNFYNGLPNLSITNFSSLTEQTPRDAINQTVSFSDFVSWSHKKHNMRFGVDVRRVHADSLGGNNVVGTFLFSGYATQKSTDQDATNSGSTAQAQTGAGFADFLLGQPQSTRIQAGLNKIYLRANVLDWYAQDDWRLLPNLSVNLGLRYEYFSPYVEKNNRLVNLDHNADFTQVTPVLPDGTGTFSGTFPRSLVNPDRSLYSPRLGVAWRPKFLKNTVIRSGYGINYNTGQFATFAQSLAFQPPFALTQTNVLGSTGNPTGCTFTNMTLADGFGCSTTQVQNSYAVNRDYRLGRVQVFNLDVQRSLPLDIVLNVGYSGSLGSNLDIVRSPNHGLTSVTTPGAQAFTYEDSVGASRFHSLVINARKRMQKGISLQGTYQYGHSIDNASSVGGQGSSIAQNDQRLDLEESNSSFDVRHRLTGNWVGELPFGPNRAFFSKGGKVSKALDGFSLSGDFTFATGSYYSPQYTGSAAQLAAGGNYTLRPNRDFSQPIAGAGRLGQWFNPAAFTQPVGFGTASRNSIRGPGTLGIDASLSRTVALGETRSFEARVTANNVFNTVQYSAINTTLNSQNFGQVTSVANARRLLFVARYRF